MPIFLPKKIFLSRGQRNKNKEMQPLIQGGETNVSPPCCNKFFAVQNKMCNFAIPNDEDNIFTYKRQQSLFEHKKERYLHWSLTTATCFCLALRGLCREAHQTATRPLR
jgi:hypothetical protein